MLRISCLYEKALFLLFVIIFFSNLPKNASGADTKEIAEGFFYHNQYQKALEYYLITLENQKEDSEIYYRIGLCYFLLQQSDKSLSYWTKAQELNPGIFKGRIFRVPASSMAPTLIVGDHILIDQDYYKHKEILQGDVIVFLSPENQKRSHIRRVIGLPGDKIEIRNKEVYIDGKKFFDKNAVFLDSKIMPGELIPRDNYGPKTVPQENYFVLGDNRDFSLDSRLFGFVGRGLIFGKALIIYFSSPDRASMENAKPERAGMLIE